MPHRGSSHGPQRGSQTGQLPKRQMQGHQVAGVAGTGAEPANRALEIADLLELSAQSLEARGVVDKSAHRSLPALDRLETGQRLGKPCPQPARAHRRYRAIQCAIKAAAAGSIVKERLEDFQVGQGGKNEGPEKVGLVKKKTGEIR